MIPYNIPCTVGTERDWVQAAIDNGHISGNGPFGQKVQDLLRAAFGFERVLLTHSCTGALEIAAQLCHFAPGDEVILPAFTHVGTANAFARAGATLVFADSSADHPNVDPASIAACITPRTRAIVVVHYAGVGCDMDAIVALTAQHKLLLIEDAAHAIGAQYRGRWLGSFGHMAAFSYHETKNITCGQGGMLVLNDAQLLEEAGVIWENGTNRAAFFRGEVGQYTWVGLGSCYTLSDLNAAYLYGQLLAQDRILARRRQIWETYRAGLAPWAKDGHFLLPAIPSAAAHNGHIFYLRLPDRGRRDALIARLRAAGVLAVFHYIPLHTSPYFQSRHHGPALEHCQQWSACIMRLPMYDRITAAEQQLVMDTIANYCTAQP